MGAPAPPRSGRSFAVARPVPAGQSSMFIRQGIIPAPPAGSGDNPAQGSDDRPSSDGIGGFGAEGYLAGRACHPPLLSRLQAAHSRTFRHDRRQIENKDQMLPGAGSTTCGQSSVVRLERRLWMTRDHAPSPREFSPVQLAEAGPEGENSRAKGFPSPSESLVTHLPMRHLDPPRRFHPRWTNTSPCPSSAVSALSLPENILVREAPRPDYWAGTSVSPC